MINEYGAVGGMKIDRGTEVLGENLPYHFYLMSLLKFSGYDLHKSGKMFPVLN
jgi:hypothetical protein